MKKNFLYGVLLSGVVSVAFLTCCNPVNAVEPCNDINLDVLGNFENEISSKEETKTESLVSEDNTAQLYASISRQGSSDSDVSVSNNNYSLESNTKLNSGIYPYLVNYFNNFYDEDLIIGNNINILSFTNEQMNDVIMHDENIAGNIKNTADIADKSVPDAYDFDNNDVVKYKLENGGSAYISSGGTSNYDGIFSNVLTKKQRQALKNANKFAASDSNLAFNPINTPYTDKTVWIRPYASFEKVKLRNQPKVSNTAYGILGGLESEIYELGNGWDGVWSVYAGYNGSHQSFQGNHINQNGGTLGLVGMAYKGNFFTGLTVNVGASMGEADSTYLSGDDDFAMLMSGIASKSGYNFELANGKFIIQPHFLLGYTFVDTFKYRDIQGGTRSFEQIHAVQLEPGVKFVGNLSNGWQPYADVSVIWNILEDENKFRANDAALPELSIKPFVKYGVGIRKTLGEKLTGYFQTFLTQGGRSGVGLQAGLRWTLGKS